MLPGGFHGGAALRALLVAALLALGAEPAFALGQLPLVSEDPSSPCASTLETAVAYSMDLVGPGHDLGGEQEFRSHLDMGAPLFQMNYGITDRIQGRVAGALVLTTVSPTSGNLAVGFSDVVTGLKYRFMDQIDGLEYEDTCTPRQSEAPYGLHGPVSISVFPQFSFPTGSDLRGLGTGEYSLEIPVDVAREFGNLYVVAEGDFVWQYHDRQSANLIEGGIAAYYSLTPQWVLLGEQRLDFATSGSGTMLWLMDIGALYTVNQYFSVFGAVGTSAAATLTTSASNFSTIVGTYISLPVNW
jgi:hypothetical protein